MSTRLVVIGAGLAGLAAALRLAEEGRAPLLLETRKVVGGRATSFDDVRSGSTIDNCQHVVLSCCTHLLDFYERIGVLEQFDWHDELFWTAGRGEISAMTPGRLPAPAHFATALKHLHVIDNSDRKAIRRAMWKLVRKGSTLRQQWRDRSFAEFLRELEQPKHAIDCFWRPIIISACNIDIDQCDAGYAMQVFQEGFLRHRFGASMGLARVALRELYEPAIRRIEASGGDVIPGVAAQSLSFDGSRITGVVTADGVINVSSVVSAVPFDRLGRLCSDALKKADTRLHYLDEFDTSAILGVHLWYEHEVMALPHLVVVDHDVQWLFNKGTDSRGWQHVHAVISAADDWMQMSEDEIVHRIRSDVEDVIPKGRGLEPMDQRVIKERRATFACTPGIDAIRPGATPHAVGAGGVRNLYLAGDWCDTGWPATMEGAVRSGYAAAGAIVERDMSVDDIPTGFLARMLRL
ncbi:MAG: hydroxysqualene dehydroxylase HpnE [Phycisphaerales bacterium]